MPTIMWLDEISVDQRTVVGGKAAHLGEMLCAGFRVPPGFCLTTAAYRAYVEDNELQQGIEALIKDVRRSGDPYALFACPMDKELGNQVLAACRQLLNDCAPGSRLAVRSSATVEDLADASFAGQGETFLNVVPGELLDRIRNCWASLWTARAVAYAHRQRGGAEISPPEMAVVVQAMVPCDVGGVAFSADPLGGETVVIEATYGLAEAVVQGKGGITRYTVDRYSLAYTQEGDDVLTPTQVRLVAETALALEKHFDGAQDAEWGMWNGELYLFQCRPITTQADRFFTQVIPGDDHLWTGGYLNERFPQPVSPLGWSIVGRLVEGLAFRAPLRFLGYGHTDRLPITKLYRGHPYTNVAVFQILYKAFPDALVPDDAVRYFPDGDTSLRKKVPYPCCLFDPRFIASMLWHFSREPTNWSPLHNYRHWARFAARHETAMVTLVQQLQDAADLDDLWAIVEAAQRWNRELLGIHRWSLMAADLAVPLLRRLVGRWVSRERQAVLCSQLLSGLPNKSLEMDRALRQLAEEPGPGTTGWRDFLTAYGHRSFSLDIYHPTFSDAPEQVSRLLKVAGQEPDPTARVAEREAAEREARTAIVSRSLGRFKLFTFDQVLTLARRYVALREDQRFVWQRSLALMRRAFLRIGEWLAAEGQLTQADDIFFLTFEELRERPQQAQQVITARRVTFERLRREFELAPHLTYPAFLHGNRPLEPSFVKEMKRWRGVPVSPGLVRGPARVVLTPDQLDRTAPGDILVTRSTDPGWTPVFGQLGGLIMEQGGQLSHGSVVAREYGLPAVVGIPHITQHLQDDDLVLLDGLTGTVTLESRR
jgi:phosphohistidine swiveling domain-containing protein